MKDLFQYEEVRALFWKQPFATLMFYGKIETRKWDTAYRGKVLICSSLDAYKDANLRNMCTTDQHQRIHFTILDDRDKENPTSFMHGFAIGVGDLIDVRPMTMADTSHSYVAFNELLYAHVYANVKRINPFPFKGFQGMRRVDKEVKDKIKIL